MPAQLGEHSKGKNIRWIAETDATRSFLSFHRHVRITPASGMTADIPDQQLRAMRHQREADADEDDSTPAATPASMGPPACSQPVPCRKLR